MQLNNAAQAGVSAAYHTCDAAHLPATQNCPALAPAGAQAQHTHHRGNPLALGGQVAEGWYCVTGTQTLKYVAEPSSKPADCSAATNSPDAPGLYLSVQARYTYKPIFPGTITSSFDPSLKRTAMARFQ
jgi:hypothetical protein